VELERGGRIQIIFMPPYSPDLNPIENFFAKHKALLRNAAEYMCCRWLAFGVGR
jgi:transposase